MSSIIDHKAYLSATLSSPSKKKTIADDFGLEQVATFLDEKRAAKRCKRALVEFSNASDFERCGKLKEAMLGYNVAYRMWPALDSVVAGGIPRGVREEAVREGYEGALLTDVNVGRARSSKVSVKRGLLNDADITSLIQMTDDIEAMEGRVGNNPENRTHERNFKYSMQLGPPLSHLRNKLPNVVGKIIKFAEDSLSWGKWTDEGGPLFGFAGMATLSIRVAEVWTYDIGGGLTDQYHFDTDSIMTIVTLLSDPGDDFDGGDFQTYESDNSQLSYGMQKGDGVCFVSHKYHNISRVTRGRRKSLVVELWEGN
ncbi:hypothetical protein TrRE_jg8879 [Triparma retinervis]|uniref:Uncharacterized protein n=1 Tax=Triparma retinervis TaxID=2557542 RepID=A0A9W7DSL9_9STRA|nr:hypothetical protein TrRE_jg8879 [Triparma retinervis]